MSNNVYDLANQLEQDLRKTDAYQNLKAAFEAVNGDETAGPLFKEFQQMQLGFQEKHMNGQEITEEEIQKAQELSATVSENKLIEDLMTVEQQMHTIINDLNRIILTPIQELYNA